MRFRPRQRPEKTRVIERLEQVIERFHLERLDCIFVVSRHENHRGRCIAAEALQNVEAIASRHLHVEEEKARFALPHSLDRLRARAALAHNRDLGIARKQRRNVRARQRLVIHDQSCESKSRPILVRHRNQRFHADRFMIANLQRARDAVDRAQPSARIFNADTRPRPDWPPAPVHRYAHTSVSTPPRSDARTRMLPPSSRCSMPCLMAFSIRGCRIRLGTSAP